MFGQTKFRVSSFSIEPRTLVPPHGVTSSYRGPSDVSAIFLLLLPASRAHSPSRLLSAPNLRLSYSRNRNANDDASIPPREITYDSQCTCLFSLVLALYNRSLFRAASGEITDTTRETGTTLSC